MDLENMLFDMDYVELLHIAPFWRVIYYKWKKMG